MTLIDYIVLLVYFIGLIGVSVKVSKSIRNSSDMFMAGRNSSWWLSGLSTYMTIFSASTFVVWGGVAYKSGLVAMLVGNLVGVACFFAGKWFAGKWRKIQLNSPGEFVKIRFGDRSLSFYSIVGMLGKGVHAGVALYAVSVVMSTLITLPAGSFFADAAGHLSVSWCIILLGVITLIYTIKGGFLAVLMTDMIQFGVLMIICIFLVPLSLHAVGGVESFVANAPEGYFIPFSKDYPWGWMLLWLGLNIFSLGGEWPYVQRYMSVPTARDAKKSNYLVFALYLLTPLIWYLPTMAYRQLNPNANPEQAYVLMSQTVLMKGMLGVMLAAMISATLSCVSGTLNVFAGVFTNNIYCRKRPDASEMTKIQVGRRFTLFFGLTIMLVSLIIPYAGGAEKVVVTILTMVISPLYIPSVWGLLSKRIREKDLLMVMIVTYLVGITGKFTVADMFNKQLFEASVGFVLPVVLLSVAEFWLSRRGVEARGYGKIQDITHAQDIVMTAEMKAGVKRYSLLAVECFVLTLGAIALLLTGMTVFASGSGPLADPFVHRTSIISAAAMLAIVAAFYIWKAVDAKRGR